MKKRPMISTYLLLTICLSLLTTSCNKNDENDPSVIKDGDGNIYQTVTIGTQVWLTENLKTTKYNDGNPIPLVADNNVWITSTTAAYCWYDNEISNENPYGALYNWNAVNTGRLCPSGWHVASDTEWTSLFSYLGGESVAGGKLKESGTIHWVSPNTGATNESGFTALPGGYRYELDGVSYYLGIGGYWWSSSGESSTKAWRISLYNDYASVFKTSQNKIQGCSVRCIKG
jgi:uncharacterized protein (TIGR02145 family)